MYHCTQCGSQLTTISLSTPLVNCPHCQTLVLLNQGHLIPQASTLVQLGQTFYYQQQAYQVLGGIQWQHALGLRYEWWVQQLETQNYYWLSEEDEDIALVQEQALIIPKTHWRALQPNTEIMIAQQNWLVTESTALHLQGTLGQTPHTPTSYLNLTYLANTKAQALQLRFYQQTLTIYSGNWLDAFEIEVVA